jgi:hypothetical protein
MVVFNSGAADRTHEEPVYAVDGVYWKSSSTAKQAGESLATQELINQWRLLPFVAAEIIDDPVGERSGGVSPC